MSFSLPCPHCQSVVELPDSEAGKVTGCPECGQAFETPPLARPLDDDAPPPRPQRSVGLGIPMSAWKALSDHTPLEDEPRRPPAPFAPSMQSDWGSAPAALASHPPLEPGWQRVAAGLRFLGGLSLLYLVGNFFAACVALVGEPEAGTFSLLYSAVGIVMLLLGLLGLWDCCAMPPQSGVRGLTLTTAWMIVAGAGLLGLGLLLTVAAEEMRSSTRNYRGEEVFIAMISVLVLVLAALALAAALIMFLFVLRGIALFYRDQRLAQNIIAYFFVVLCAPVAVFILLMCLGVLLVDSRSGRGTLPLLLWTVSLVVVTGLTLWFFNLLRDTRSRIDMALQGAAATDWALRS